VKTPNGRIPDFFEVTHLKADSHPPEESLGSEGNVGNYFDHFDENCTVSSKTIIYHDAGIFFLLKPH
jgi:hypothetical protein